MRDISAAEWDAMTPAELLRTIGEHLGVEYDAQGIAIPPPPHRAPSLGERAAALQAYEELQRYCDRAERKHRHQARAQLTLVKR